jgi:lipoprotein-releasing system ATP-binding protein
VGVAELAVEHVAKEYLTDGQPLVVLRDISLTLAAGESMAILGPSGSGKSTLLSIVGTLDQPSSGRVLHAGQSPHELSGTALAEFRRRHIGFVFQDHLLLPHLTALENVLVPALANGTVSGDAQERGRDLLSRVGLKDRLHHRPHALSGGERQRTALARALVNQPSLILADEPTGNLDRTNATMIAELLRQLQREHRVILLIATHSQELAHCFDQQRYLEDGILMAKEVTEQSRFPGPAR